VSTTLSKGWFLADSGRPCRRTVQTCDDESPQAPSDFRHPGERRACCRRSGSRRPYCYGRAGERAVRLTTSVALAGAFHRRHGPRAPSRGVPANLEEGGEPLLDAVSSISWSPIARVGVWRALPRGEPAEDPPDVTLPAKGTNVRTNRDAFGRPSLVRAREDCSSACSSGTRIASSPVREKSGVTGFSAPLVPLAPSRPPLAQVAIPLYAGVSPLTREGGDRRRPFDGWRRRVARRWGPSGF